MRAAGGALVLVLLSGCAGPSRTDGDYRAKAANTAEAVVSAVNTARLALDALREDRVPAAYLTRLVAEAEEDALAAQQAFDSVQPPSEAADSVHDHLDELVNDALDALRTLRVGARRGDTATLLAETAPLADVAQRLEDFEEHPS